MGSTTKASRQDKTTGLMIFDVIGPWVSMTRAGAKAYQQHVQALREVLDGAPDATPAHND